MKKDKYGDYLKAGDVVVTDDGILLVLKDSYFGGISGRTDKWFSQLVKVKNFEDIVKENVEIRIKE